MPQICEASAAGNVTTCRDQHVKATHGAELLRQPTHFAVQQPRRMFAKQWPEQCQRRPQPSQADTCLMHDIGVFIVVKQCSIAQELLEA